MFLANFRAGRRSRYCRHDDWLETFWTGLIRLRPGSRSELRVIKLSATGVCALASSCNLAMEVVRSGWASADSNLKFPPTRPPSGMLRLFDVRQTHRGAGAAMAQPFFFLSASNHSTEPG